MEKKFALAIAVVFICASLVGYVQAQEAELHPSLLEAFESNELVNVIVELKDESGIEVVGTKEERRALIFEIDDWFKPRVSEVAEDYAARGVNITKERSRSFTAVIDEEELLVLLDDPRIYTVHYNSPVFILANESEPASEENQTVSEVVEDTEELESESEVVSVETESNTFTWVFFPIGLLVIAVILVLFIKRRSR